MGQQAMGVYGQTMIDFETSFNVVPTPTAGKIIPFITNQVNSKQSLIKSKVISGVRSEAQPAYGNTDVSGTLTTPVDLASIGYWLKALIATPTNSTNASGVAGTDYTHVFKLGTASLNSMIIDRLVGSDHFIYHGCKLDTFKMSVGGDTEIEAQMDYIGCASTVGPTAYDPAPTTILQTSKLNQFMASITIGGTAATGVIQSGDFTINNNLDKNGYTVGSSGYRSQITEGLCGVSGAFKVLFEDLTFLNYGINQTTTSIAISWTISATKSLTFLFPEVNFSRSDALITGPGGVVVDLSWEGFWQSDSNDSAVVITLNNQIASY